MLMTSAAALPATISSVSGVAPPTHHAAATSAAIVAASVADNHNHQKDTTFTKIFVGGLPYHTSDKSLREHFEVYGEIEEAVVITDRQTGKSRGYGFVTMADRSGAERAIKDPNPVIDGRKANVNLAYLGAKPRGTPTSTFASLAPATMRVFSQLGAAGAPYSYDFDDGKRKLKSPMKSVNNCLHPLSLHAGYLAHYQPQANYVYQLPYASPGHFPLLSAAQTAHLSPAAAATAYSPAADYATGAAYTTAAYPGTHAVDHFGMAALTAGGLPGYNYAALTHAAAANTFSLGAPAYQTAAQQQATLQEARMQYE